MKLRTNITLSMVIVGIFVLVMIWRFDQTTVSEKLAWAEAKMRAQVGTFVPAVQAELKLIQQNVIPAYAHLEANRQGNVPFTKWGNVSGVGLLTLTSEAPILEAVQFAAPEVSESISLEAVKGAVEKIKSQDIRAGSTPIIGFANEKGQKYIGVVFPLLVKWTSNANVVASSAALGIMKTEVFQALMDRQKAFSDRAIILNDEGYAIGHNEADYAGIKVKDPSLSKLLQDGRLVAGPVARLDLPQGEFLSVQEQVPKSNLVVVLQTPIAQITQGRAQAALQFIILGIGCLMLIFAINRHHQDGQEEAETTFSVPLVESKPNVSTEVETQAAPKVFATKPSYESNDRGMANRKLVANLTHEISAPLSTILGHVHLAQRTDSIEKIKAHMESIETEVRKSRSFIEKLNDYSGEKQQQPEKLDLELVFSTFFEKLKPVFQRENIKLILPDVNGIYIRSSKENFEKVLHALVQNSIEAMRGVSSKQLNITVHEERFMVEILIQDTGEGISPENLNKIANPFFTTRSPALHLGLGLSVVSGLVREHQAEFRVESELRKGTTVFLRWPLFVEENAVLEQVFSNVLAAETSTEVAAKVEAEASGDQEDIFGNGLMEDLQNQVENSLLMPAQEEAETAAKNLTAEEVFAKQVEELLELPPMPEQVNGLVQDLKTAIIDAADQKANEMPDKGNEDIFENPAVTQSQLSHTPVEQPQTETEPAQEASPERTEQSLRLSDEFEKTMVVENIAPEVVDNISPQVVENIAPQVVVEAKTEVKVEPQIKVEATKPIKSGFQLPSVKPTPKTDKLQGFQVKIRRPGEKTT